jgi:hypothetical protein
LWAQEGFWRMDSHRDEVYRCRLNLCLGEAQALASVHGSEVDAEDFLRTLSEAERETPVALDTCRPGTTAASLECAH